MRLQTKCWRFAAAVAAVGCLTAGTAAQLRQRPAGGAGPPDPPAWYRSTQPANITTPSVVPGKPAGIDVGQYAPDFELEPVAPSPELKTWLGDKAPASIEHGVKLSDLTGKAPVMMFFGSYT